MQIKFELPPLAKPNEWWAIDSEWFGMDSERLHRPITGRFACATFASVSHPETVYFVDDPKDMPEALKRLGPAERWVFQNASFDLVQFRRLAEVKPRKIYDTMLGEQTLFNNYYDTFGLKPMTRRYFGVIMDKEARDEFQTATSMNNRQVEYACRDVMYTAMIVPKQQALLTDKLRYINDEIDLPMVWAIMDFKGFLFDTVSWLKMARANQAEADRLEKEFTFNPRSNPQTLAALKKAGLRTITSTGAKAIARYKDNPLVKLLQQYRSVEKLTSTYGENFLKWVEEDGRIHTNYKIIGADTGRIASDDPALQNIPKQDCFRTCFICPKDMILIKGDYSAQEPRTTAYRSQDPRLIEIVTSGGDIHTETARLIFHDMSIQKSDIQRKKAKALGLGLNYGMTWRGLMEARDLVSQGIYLTETEAKETIKLYFDTFPGVKDLIYEDRKFAKEHEYVETLLGRKCWVNLHNYKGLNNAINAPNQGSGADMTKLGIRQLHQCWPADFGPFGVVETTHDSISIEVPKEMKKLGTEFLRESMLYAANMVCPDFPFAVDVEAGRTWGTEKDE